MWQYPIFSSDIDKYQFADGILVIPPTLLYKFDGLYRDEDIPPAPFSLTHDKSIFDSVSVYFTNYICRIS